MASRLDRRLEKLLAALAARLGESFEIAIRLNADEEDNDVGELAEALVSAGLLLPAEPAGAVICDGCERNCAMPVEIAPAINGRPSRAFIICDKRDDIGRVRVEPARLRRWTFSFSLLARALAKALKSDQEPAQEGEIWLLGNAKIGRNITQVTLARRAQDAPIGAQLAIVLAAAGDQGNAGRWITLESGFSLRDGCLTPRADLLRAPALSHPCDDPTIALEIRFDFGDVLLINRLTGASKKIASPHLGSQTDQVFKILHANPGQLFSGSELRQTTGLSALKSLHKIPENLNFMGNLKRVFFEVSKHKIRFQREVTLGQLATYHIDPKTII